MLREDLLESWTAIMSTPVEDEPGDLAGFYAWPSPRALRTSLWDGCRATLAQSVSASEWHNLNRVFWFVAQIQHGVEVKNQAAVRHLATGAQASTDAFFSAMECLARLGRLDEDAELSMPGIRWGSPLDTDST